MDRAQNIWIGTILNAALAFEIRIFAGIFAAATTFCVNVFCFILGLEMYSHLEEA